jgi:MFS family permease
MARLSLKRDHPARRNFTLHLLGGGGLVMALQFGSPYLVLPWIGQNLGVAYILVALLVPLAQAGGVLSQLTLAPRIAGMTLRKPVVAGTGLLLAGLFALTFVAAATFSPALAGLALLASAASFGVAFGVFAVGNADLVAKTVHSRLRGKVLAQRGALGGVLILAANVAIWILLPGESGNHLLLLWLAVGGWLGAAAAYAAIQEAPSEPAPVKLGMIDLRRGRALIVENPWFARLLILRTLLLSVELATAFYAIHAASLHGPSARNLGAFVVAMSLGLMLSGPVWGHLIDRDWRLVIVACCLLAALCGASVLVLDQIGEPGVPFYHAFLFLPLALATQGVINARTRYLSVKASDQDRPAMFGLSNALLTCASVGVAFVLGLVGHLHDIRTPLVILMVVNLAAALYARRAFAG